MRDPWLAGKVSRRGFLHSASAAALVPWLGKAARASSSPVQVGQPAPDFARQALDGRTLRLSDLRGRVVLLNFWATWCAPCLKEMPVFAQWMVELNSHGLDVLGVNMDDDPEPVRTVVSRLHLNYPVVRGDAALGRRFGGVLGLPVSFLIDRQGRVRRRFDGAADLAAMHGQIITLLG